MAGELVFITGATGFVGFQVLHDLLKGGYRARVSVRRESSIQEIKEHRLIAPYAGAVEFVIIKDITADGEFDSVLKDVTYIEHIASPLPSPSAKDFEHDIVISTIHGTTSILNSALKFPSIRRVVITSSVTAVIPQAALINGDDVNVYSANSRTTPLPKAPFDSAPIAYFSSKTLALNATERFLDEKKPHFSIVNIMPGYIVGRSELVTVAEDLLKSTNVVVLGPILGQQAFPRACEVIDVRDVSRIHIESLDEKKVVGSKSFVLHTGKLTFDDALDVAATHFPDAVKAGVLPLGGTQPAVFQNVDTSDTTNTFGPLHTYEEAVIETVRQYIELKAKA